MQTPEPISEEPVVTPAEEVVDYKEQWARARADLENLRKRSEVERMAALKYASQSLVEDLIPVVDNFYRATEHIPAEQQNSPWVAGIQYIQKNLLDVLVARGLSEIPAKDGDHFDPSIHEAIKQEETSDEALDSTIIILNKGYRLHDKLVRPVHVQVYHYVTK